MTALHTAASFVSGTAWQAYAPETTLSLLSQAIGIGVAEFVSTASGIAVAFVVMRGFALSATNVLGNFWVDSFRSAPSTRSSSSSWAFRRPGSVPWKS